MESRKNFFGTTLSESHPETQVCHSISMFWLLKPVQVQKCLWLGQLLRTKGFGGRLSFVLGKGCGFFSFRPKMEQQNRDLDAPCMQVWVWLGELVKEWNLQILACPINLINCRFSRFDIVKKMSAIQFYTVIDATMAQIGLLICSIVIFWLRNNLLLSTGNPL